MPAKFSQSIRSLVASSFVRSLQIKTPDIWKTGVLVATGTVMVYNGIKYISTSAGTTGNSPPSHVTGTQTDGAVNWMAVEPMQMDNSFQGNLYFFIGRNREWVNENSPPEPDMSDFFEYDTLDSIITLRKVMSEDIQICIRRHDWASGAIYASYDSSKDAFDPNSYDRPFYVITNDLNIYKCLDNNNNGPSQSKPTGTSAGIVNYSDGYSWKYMGSISNDAASRFSTEDYVPVSIKLYNDGSPQWLVQTEAKPASVSSFKILSQTGVFNTPITTIEGAGTGLSAFAVKSPSQTIRQVLLTNGGQNYTTETYAIIRESAAVGSGATATAVVGTDGTIQSISVSAYGSNYNSAIAIITGDGQNATATVTVAANKTIQSVTITNAGSGYTTARVWIIPGAVGAVAKAVMAPNKGNGHNIITELGASAIVINNALSRNDLHLLMGSGSSFRQIGIVTDVKDSAGYANKPYYIGPAHPEFASASSTLNKIVKRSGYVLYLSNINSVSRSAGQEEHIKLTIIF